MGTRKAIEEMLRDLDPDSAAARALRKRLDAVPAHGSEEAQAGPRRAQVVGDEHMVPAHGSDFEWTKDFWKETGRFPTIEDRRAAGRK